MKQNINVNTSLFKLKPKMKFRFAMKEILFTLLFIAGEMKCNIVLGVVGVQRPIKKCKQTRARYRDKDVGGKNASIYLRNFMLNQHSN